jgi:hypothetical protein
MCRNTKQIEEEYAWVEWWKREHRLSRSGAIHGAADKSGQVPPQLKRAGRMVYDVYMIAGVAGGQDGRRSEACIFWCGGHGGERRLEKKARILQQIWTIEVGNRKITNEPLTYRLHCNHWLSI